MRFLFVGSFGSRLGLVWVSFRSRLGLVFFLESVSLDGRAGY